MWGDSYDDEPRGTPYFEVTCPSCGSTRRNDDPYCQCGSSGESYSNEDAVRWNRHVDRQARGW